MKKWSAPLKVFVIVATVCFVFVLIRNIYAVIDETRPLIGAVVRLMIGGVIGGSVVGGIAAGITALVINLRKLGD